MKSQIIKHIALFLFVTVFISGNLLAQCPASKYGINPVWPVNWSVNDRQSWYLDMKTHGQGFQSDGRTWRQLQEMADSNLLDSFRNEVIWAKTYGGIEKYLFQMKNPGPLLNGMPPVWCGNSLTDTNTTKAMFRFIVTFLDTMHTVLDYFVLGSESDLYFKSRPAERDSFLVMVNAVSDYIDTTYPSIKFGIGISMNTPVGGDPILWNIYKPIGDFIAVSWWPIYNDYSVNVYAIDSAESDIADLLVAAGTKPVVIVDCGVPSGTENGSEGFQADFVEKTFLTTMTNPQIEAVGYHFLADFDSVQIAWNQYYFMSYSNELYQSIISRGLLDSLGNPKMAYGTYLNMLDTACLHFSIEEPGSEKLLSVFPNPCADFLTLSGFSNEERTYSIYDNTGRQILAGVAEKNGIIDVSVLVAGVYHLSVQSGKSFEWHLFIKSSEP